MGRTRVKICGITRLEDALLAARLGADALGFVFVAASPRRVSVGTARAIVAALPPFVSRVGLFLDAEAEEVERTLAALPGLVPQFHGRESADFCERFGPGYVKAFGVAEGLPARATLDAYAGAAGFLFDSHAPGALGGTGRAFDWNALRADIGRPLVLAGGLDADNVARAVRELRPWALDVSSGVEASKGVKDAAALAAFMRAVREADAAVATGAVAAHEN